ncbi:hypothetical protein LQK89_02855 [Curtobacterium sp. C1]|uniref:hypothetical protein n=1 Tax=Curtobacterium sp. C1 TaxID=2898151 RepID=UPI001E529113|nr:hypothetical protein [Curtobacterium sp. C1]UFU14658.1 hypothetical protein LQK89_02855 [Curtobacterium sp. C1]
MQTRSIGVLAGIALLSVTLAGCVMSPAQPSSPTHTSKAAGSAPAAASDFDEPPAVGSTASAAPYPDCAVTVAGWTATATGKPWVTVNTDGVDFVTALVTLASGVTERQTFEIPDGQDTHIFEFNDVKAADVKTVVVTATGNARSQGGSCIATGSPDA